MAEARNVLGAEADVLKMETGKLVALLDQGRREVEGCERELAGRIQLYLCEKIGKSDKPDGKWNLCETTPGLPLEVPDETTGKTKIVLKGDVVVVCGVYTFQYGEAVMIRNGGLMEPHNPSIRKLMIDKELQIVSNVGNSINIVISVMDLVGVKKSVESVESVAGSWFDRSDQAGGLMREIEGGVGGVLDMVDHEDGAGGRS